MTHSTTNFEQTVLPFWHKNLKTGDIYEKEVVFTVQNYYSISYFSFPESNGMISKI
jgi:hypothetical protein